LTPDPKENTDSCWCRLQYRGSLTTSVISHLWMTGGWLPAVTTQHFFILRAFPPPWCCCGYA